jgi:hypothetical protein
MLNERDTIHEQVRFLPEFKSALSQKSVHTKHFISRQRPQTNHKIISTDVEKVSDKTPYHFMIKPLSELGTENKKQNKTKNLP